MTDFEGLYKEIEKIDEKDYKDEINARVVKFASKDRKSWEVLNAFIYKSIAADGKLDEAEFDLVAPFLEAVVGKKVTYDDAVKAFNETAIDDEVFDVAIKAYKSLTEEERDDIAMVCMMICAIDDNLDIRELFWLGDIIE